MKFEEVKAGMVLHNLQYQLHYLFVKKVNKKFILGDRIFYNDVRVDFSKDIKVYKSGWKDWQLNKAMIEVRQVNYPSVIYAIFGEKK